MTTVWLRRFSVVSLLSCLLPTVLPTLQVQAQTATATPPLLRVLVNSAQDGFIQPDQGLTLREAIALTNGELTLDRLSPQESAQVQPAQQSAVGSEIGFNLPPDQTTIYSSRQFGQDIRYRSTPLCFDVQHGKTLQL